MAGPRALHPSWLALRSGSSSSVTPSPTAQAPGAPDDSLGPRLSAALTADGFDVDLHVLAVPGAVSAQLGAQVRRAEALRPDLAVVVIGANDLARFVPADRAAADLGAAVAALRAAGTDVVVVPAPDMSSVPFVPPAFRPPSRRPAPCSSSARRAVAEAAGATVAAHRREVGRAFAADPALFSADRFHPSSAGYGRSPRRSPRPCSTAARSRRDEAAA